MRFGGIALVIALCASCGRFGFDGEENLTADAAAEADPDAGEAAATLIGCGEPKRFQVGTAGIDYLHAVATSTGFALFGFDGTDTINGWAYEWQSGSLVATAENVPLGSGLTSIYGASVVGNDVLVAVVTASGETRLFPLTNSLDSRGASSDVLRPAGFEPIAAASDGSGLAMITIDPSTFEVDAQRITTLGAPSGAAVNLVPGTENPGLASIRPGGPGFVVSFTSAIASPNELKLALVDASLAAAPAVTLPNTTGFDPLRPRVLWAPVADVYLVSWFEKNVTGDDDVWIQVFDTNLAPITTATVIANFAVEPRVATDGENFWIAWRNYNLARIETARVTAAGAVSLQPVPTSGGTGSDWALAERQGQVILAWTEFGGSGPDLWLTAMCK